MYDEEDKVVTLKDKENTKDEKVTLSGGTVQTGDANNTMVYIIPIMLIIFGAIFYFTNKKKNNKK